MFIAIELDRSRISAFDRFFCLFQRECMSLRTIDIAFFIRLHPIAPEPVLVRDLFLFFVHGMYFTYSSISCSCPGYRLSLPDIQRKIP